MTRELPQVSYMQERVSTYYHKDTGNQRRHVRYVKTFTPEFVFFVKDIFLKLKTTQEYVCPIDVATVINNEYGTDFDVRFIGFALKQGNVKYDKRNDVREKTKSFEHLIELSNMIKMGFDTTDVLLEVFPDWSRAQLNSYVAWCKRKGLIPKEFKVKRNDAKTN